jgi:hypothetical protein
LPPPEFTPYGISGERSLCLWIATWARTGVDSQPDLRDDHWSSEARWEHVVPPAWGFSESPLGGKSPREESRCQAMRVPTQEIPRARTNLAGMNSPETHDRARMLWLRPGMDALIRARHSGADVSHGLRP